LLDEGVKNIRCVNKAEPTEEDHLKAQHDWKRHIEILAKEVEPKGAHYISFMKLQNMKEGDAGLTGLITELKTHIVNLHFCPQCSDQYLCYAVALGQRDPKCFQK